MIFAAATGSHPRAASPKPRIAGTGANVVGCDPNLFHFSKQAVDL